jgi:hypothetical protein
MRVVANAVLHSGSPQVQPPSLAQAALVRCRLPLPSTGLDLLLAFLEPGGPYGEWELRGDSVEELTHDDTMLVGWGNAAKGGVC